MLASALLVMLVARPMPPVVENAAANDVDPRVLALTLALEAYESSTQDLTWSQRVFAPPAAHLNRPEWTLVEESARTLDREGRWTLTQHWRSNSGPPDYRFNSERMLYMGNPDLRLALDLANPTGLLTDNDRWFFTTAYPLSVTGRFLDYGAWDFGRSLSQLIAASDHVEYLPPTDAEPWPGLRAAGEAGAGGAALIDIEVRVDPAHGFAPRSIRTPRRSDGLEAQHEVVLSYHEVDGVFFPRCIVGVRNYAEIVADVDDPLSAEVAADIETAALLTGLPASAEGDVLASLIRSMTRTRVLDRGQRIVGGPLVCFAKGTGLVTPTVCFVDRVGCAAPSSPDGVLDLVPTDRRFLDGRTGGWISADEAGAVMRSLWAPVRRATAER